MAKHQNGPWGRVEQPLNHLKIVAQTKNEILSRQEKLFNTAPACPEIRLFGSNTQKP
jgi:hypothetical protein